MLRFHFPIVIIDEDYRSENASGLGIRALADAIKKEGMDVLGVTSYGDLSQFAQQQSRASAFAPENPNSSFTVAEKITVFFRGLSEARSRSSATSMAAMPPFTSQDPRP